MPGASRRCSSTWTCACPCLRCQPCRRSSRRGGRTPGLGGAGRGLAACAPCSCRTRRRRCPTSSRRTHGASCRCSSTWTCVGSGARCRPCLRARPPAAAWPVASLA
uniref:Uncharacterized protein n=1 Tax=Ixodes ricinus TaxID=34613 RepID=A0A6B0UHZ1_IXORI